MRDLHSGELESLFGGREHLDNLEPEVAVAAVGPLSGFDECYQLVDGNAERGTASKVPSGRPRAPCSP